MPKELPAFKQNPMVGYAPVFHCEDGYLFILPGDCRSIPEQCVRDVTDKMKQPGMASYYKANKFVGVVPVSITPHMENLVQYEIK